MEGEFITGNDSSLAASTQSVIAMCQNFVAGDCPDGNVILEEDFERFRPLFTKKMAEEMNLDELQKLAEDFYLTVSNRHPVFVISRELDKENGKYWFGDKEKHKVITILPPAKRECHSLNALHGYMIDNMDVTDLITAFINSTLQKTPGDYRDAKYAAYIRAAIRKANPRSPNDKEEHQFIKLSEGVLNNNPSKSDVKKPTTKQAAPVTPSKPAGPSQIDFDW